MVDSQELGNSILVRSPNWLGDAIMTMPAIAALLEESQGKRKVSILTPAKLKEVWKLIPAIEEILVTSASLRETAHTIRSHRFESGLIFPNSTRTALEMFLGKVPKRFGYRGHWRKWLLTQAFTKEKQKPPHHQKLDYLQMIRHIGISASDQTELPLIPITSPRPFEAPYIALCPGAEFGPAKRWLPERFAQTADELARKHNWHVILLGAPVDREASVAVAHQMKTAHTDLTGKTSLADFIQYLMHSDLVLCNDSGSMHLAALLRRPAVALFGSTEPGLTGPLSPTIQVLREKVACSPCFLRECPIDFRCMKRLTVEQTLIAADRAWTMK